MKYPPRISLHIVLSLGLIPLLAVKIIIARRYPRFSPNLVNFGLAVLIFAVALSGLTAGYYFLHSSDFKYVSLGESDTQMLDKTLGQQLVNQKCNKCHSLERVYRAVKNETGWTSTINKMASLDAPNLSSFDIKQAIHFLTNRQEQTVTDKTQLNNAVGRTIMETKCTACHALDRIIRAQKDKGKWGKTIKRMIKHRGDPEYLTKEEKTELIEFLSSKDK